MGPGAGFIGALVRGRRLTASYLIVTNHNSQ